MSVGQNCALLTGHPINHSTSTGFSEETGARDGRCGEKKYIVSFRVQYGKSNHIIPRDKMKRGKKLFVY